MKVHEYIGLDYLSYLNMRHIIRRKEGEARLCIRGHGRDSTYFKAGTEKVCQELKSTL